MNLYFFELKHQWKTTILWTVSIILIFTFLQLGIYPAFSENMQDLEEMIRSMPEVFLKAFGFDLTTMSGFGEFFKLTYRYLVLMASIMGMVLSVASFSRERRSKCSEFLLTKPISRTKIFLLKLEEVLSLTLFSWFLILISAIVLYIQSKESISEMRVFVLSVMGLFFTQLLFVGIGTFYAVTAKKVRSVSGTALAAGFAGFILTSLQEVIGDEKLRYIAPLNYFNPQSVYENGFFELRFVLICSFATVFCLLAAWYFFSRRDMKSV